MDAQNPNHEEIELPEASEKEVDEMTEQNSDSRSGNKYQWADLISNDEYILDVYVKGEEIEVIYQLAQDLDLSWVGNYMEKKNYKYDRSEIVFNNVQKDVFVDNHDN